MRKLFLSVLLCIIFIPFIVNAEECDIDKITINSMKKTSIEGNTEEIEEPTFKDRNIDLNLKMYEVGDSISYDMTIKNDSNDDYMIDENTFKTDSKYILYTLKTNDGSNVVKANNTKLVTLIVSYKKEVDNSLLNDNKYDASNDLNLSLNSSVKGNKLGIISTNNIKKNPLTNNSIISLICFLIVIIIISTYLFIHNKKKYNIYLLLIVSVLLIPSVYAVCKADIKVESTIEIEKLPKLFDTVVGLLNEDNACVTKYEGEVTDEVGKTVNASKVYFDKCAEQRNVIFGGFCWQVIRTTETGGTKLIYNGEPVEGKCENTRPLHAGLVGYADSYNTLDGELLYSNSFTYDLDNGVFNLKDTFLETWSDSTYENLIGKYTCGNNNDTCTTLYGINSYLNNNTAYMVDYGVDSINYAHIGISPFNSRTSLSGVGYMFNDNYNNADGGQIITGSVMYGSSFIYDNNTNTYTLSGTTHTFSDWRSAYNQLNYTHYTCWNNTGSCSTISYISATNSLYPIYYNLTKGESINDMINAMLFDDNVNNYNSAAKSMIDIWYKYNFTKYTDQIEKTVYCNARNIVDYGTFNPNGGDTYNYPNDTLLFKSNNNTIDLTCPNITDQFSTKNDKAKLIYPVSLVTAEEMSYISENSLRQTGEYYWTLSPVDFSNYYSSEFRVYYAGTIRNDYVDNTQYFRPVISLKSTDIVESGDGTSTNPYVIKTT